MTTPRIIESLSELSTLVERWRSDGCRIVTTNGCFDLLHPGHIETLTFAKKQGDVLIVGVDTDSHVAQLKGPDRPFTPLANRMLVISALRPVDAVVPIDNVMEFLTCVRPDVHVKGGDYSSERLPETKLVQELGGKVALSTFRPGFSTTGIVTRVRGG